MTCASMWSAAHVLEASRTREAVHSLGFLVNSQSHPGVLLEEKRSKNRMNSNSSIDASGHRGLERVRQIMI